MTDELTPPGRRRPPRPSTPEPGRQTLVKATSEMAHVSCATAESCWALAFHGSPTLGVTTVVLPVDAGVPGATHPAPQAVGGIGC
ncbi:MAG: hypothetical protein ACYDEN_09840, partial [Acidimicrobiales bacterium]